jgi:hypothetical protein
MTSEAAKGVDRPPESRFGAVARVDMQRRQALELFHLGDELLMDTGLALFSTRGGLLDVEPQQLEGAPPFYRVSDVVGRFPDDAWLTAMVATDNAGQGMVFHWHGGWKRALKPLPELWEYVGIANLGSARKVALVAGYRAPNSTLDAHFQTVAGANGELPTLTQARREGQCHAVRLRPQAFVGFPSGRLLVYGALCDTGQPALEVFEPGKKRSTITVLDAFRGERCAELGVDCARQDAFFVARGERDVYLVQTNRILHFDGDDWRSCEVPVTTQPIVALSAAGDDVWLVAARGEHERGELWRRSGNEPWVREPLPALPDGPLDNEGATDVVAVRPDLVWVSANAHLLRSGYSGELQLLR